MKVKDFIKLCVIFNFYCACARVQFDFDLLGKVPKINY